MKRFTGALALCLSTAALTGAGAGPTAAAAMGVNPACAPLKAKLAGATSKKQRQRIKAKLRGEACPGY